MVFGGFKLHNMLLIEDLDAVSLDDAERVRKIAVERSRRWNLPYHMALDYTLIEIDKLICKKTGETYIPNDKSCKEYELSREVQ